MISILEETLEPPMIAVKGRLISFNTLSTAATSFSIKKPNILWSLSKYLAIKAVEACAR